MDNLSSTSLPGWDPQRWLEKFSRARNKHPARIDVWENTLSAVKSGGYTLPDGTPVTLCLSRDPSAISFFYSDPFTPDFHSLASEAAVTVGSGDCLDAAKAWREEGLEVCVLNMANAYNPGGGVIGGSGAQEEYLFRCSDYFRSLYRYAPYADKYGLRPSRRHYPLNPDFGGVFSPRVTVFRGNEEEGYPFLKKPWTVNMIAVAGVDTPDIIRGENGESLMSEGDAARTKNKIRTILRIAAENSQRFLVLGALGCGAFSNPPAHVARLFRDVLLEPEFKGAFRAVHFAVKTDHNSHGSLNFDAFQKELDGLTLPPA